MGEKGKRRGQIRKNIGEPSETSGGLGSGKGRRSLEKYLWYRQSMIPILVSCSDWSNVSRSFKITLLQFGKRLSKTRISSKQYKFLLRDFSLIPWLQEEPKNAFGQLQKEKEAFKISSFSCTLPWENYGHIYKAIDLYIDVQKAQQYNHTPTKSVIKPQNSTEESLLPGYYKDNSGWGKSVKMINYY